VTPSSAALLQWADVVLRVTALSSDTTSDTYTFAANGEPSSTVYFRVTEVLRGQAVGSDLTLNAFLEDRDDFNDKQPPYTFVRPSGRMGNCYADFYRGGGDYLLLLKRRPDGRLTTRWAPLAPANEQLHGGDDAWLNWVRTHVG
jgi:hypothetical protein